jgi:tRNA threonylcarbamoyladenosine biosynthesis protein TsaB
MDARMNEVYWGLFKYAADGLVVSSSIEQVTAPERVIQFVDEEQRMPAYVIGTGVDAYPVLREHFSQVHIHGDALPRAAEIAALAARDFYQGLAVTAAEAQPVYLRDQVTHVNPRT